MGEAATSQIEELGGAACWALLRETAVGRIALHGPDDIEIFPINFVVDGGSIVFRTAAGTKLTLIGEGTRCTFEADGFDSSERLAWSVVLKGSVRPITGHESIIETFGVEVVAWQTGGKPTYVRIKPQVVTGRRFLVTADD